MTTYGTASYNGTSYTLYGRPGSTLQAELNRLANGGEYPSPKDFLDTSGAVNRWVGTPPGLGLIAALNYKVSSSRPRDQYKDLNGIACEIAGIPMPYVEAVTALRTIAS